MLCSFILKEEKKVPLQIFRTDFWKQVFDQKAVPVAKVSKRKTESEMLKKDQ